MDERAQSFSPFYNHPESPKIYLPKPAGTSSSGLTLVIPSLKSLKTASKQKHRSASHPYSASAFPDVEPQEKKIPRPVKLKPLKEVLSKLIAQLKKKDDYAFFLHPVDAASVPGYSDVVKRPMDLGTMSDKVARGKYRSLEDFASDFRLVTNNAKLFNPPGTIYHTEADRLEAWGLDHISKAASTVIQYETDWNIEIEKDEEVPVNVDEDDDDAPMDVDTNSRDRSVSVVSQPPPPGAAPTHRRGPRGPYRKQNQNGQPGTLSESLEPDGGLPGSKDGLGSFPPGSDWAKTMVALKLKGKRYRTKKERLRFERDGPPFLADGSLDYTEMEDPFSVLSCFVPDPPSRPQLVPLYPPLHNPPPPPPPPPQAESSTSQTPQLEQPPPPPVLPTTVPLPPFPSATSVPLDHPPLTLPFLNPDNNTANNNSNDTSGKAPRRRHWTVVRNASSRHKGKEREDELHESLGADLPAWQMPREAHALDYGSFSVLAGALAEEMRKAASAPVPGPAPISASASASTPINNGLVGASVNANGAASQNSHGQNDEETAMELIRASLRYQKPVESTPSASSTNAARVNGTVTSKKSYFTTERAMEAEEYIKDVVYGGVEGLAYIRSLAEFVNGDTYYKEEEEEEEGVKREPGKRFNPALGMPLSQWVERNIIDPLTDGRHALLREAAVELIKQQGIKASDPLPKGKVPSQVATSLHKYPAAMVAISKLSEIRMHKIDMGSLIKEPNELFLSEEEWAGKWVKERREKAKEKEKEKMGDPVPGTQSQPQPPLPLAAAASTTAEAEPEEEEEEEEDDDDDAMEVEEPEQTWAGVDASVKDRANGHLSTSYQQEGPDELREVLDYVADAILEVDKKIRAAKAGSSSSNSARAVQSKPDVEMEPPSVTVNGVKAEESGSDNAVPQAESVAPPPPPPETETSSTPAEDPEIRHLRLNLLALSKRAPLDTIARLPKDLVPEHIRNLVPTLGSTA
ncbi:hypothetical protein D9613_009462 [Agrocybe pediades]|uniref:Bromo domain-containing protein n=1 Tax=Agrocybe pediades TaxID=84607 RepID=A0A8H4R3J9_9AGAR|nr:hypothetical protein D9613_009462 [Agrocybe pediades]